jgi:hypothetical protein
VVDDRDGQVVGALEFAQVAEDRGDLTGLVFVDAMEPDEVVEQEQARGLAPHGLGQAALVPGQIEPHAGRGDDEQGERREGQAAVATEAGEARLDDGRGILGHVDGALPGSVTGKVSRHGVPLATATASSRPSQLLPHLGAPPMIPTPARAQRGSISQRRVGSGSSSAAARTTGSPPSVSGLIRPAPVPTARRRWRPPWCGRR